MGGSVFTFLDSAGPGCVCSEFFVSPSFEDAWEDAGSHVGAIALDRKGMLVPVFCGDVLSQMSVECMHVVLLEYLVWADRAT